MFALRLKPALFLGSFPNALLVTNVGGGYWHMWCLSISTRIYKLYIIYLYTYLSTLITPRTTGTLVIQLCTHTHMLTKKARFDYYDPTKYHVRRRRVWHFGKCEIPPCASHTYIQTHKRAISHHLTRNTISRWNIYSTNNTQPRIIHYLPCAQCSLGKRHLGKQKKFSNAQQTCLEGNGRQREAWAD